MMYKDVFGLKIKVNREYLPFGGIKAHIERTPHLPRAA